MSENETTKRALRVRGDGEKEEVGYDNKKCAETERVSPQQRDDMVCVCVRVCVCTVVFLAFKSS